MIGKTNAQTSASGGIKGEKVNIFLKTNQSSHEDLKGAIITVSYATVVEEYTWNGNTITVEIPPYVNYSVGVSNVEGYAAPSSYSSTSVPENAKSVELEYRTTIVKAVVKSNQSDTSDLANATLTVNGVTLKNGQTTKIATDSTVTASWSDVTDYKKPSSTSVTISGASQNIEGTYQTEIVSVTLSIDDGSSVYGASVTINGKSYTWDGNAITQKVAFGTSYTVSVGEMSGLSQPSAQTFTANQASREVSFVYIKSTLVVNILSNQSEDSEIGSIKATVSYGSTSVQVSSGEKINIPVGSQTITITFPDRNGWKKPSTIRFSNTSGGEVVKSGTYQTEIVYVSTYSYEGGITGFTTTVKKVDGTVLGTSSASMLICTVPSGTQYIVSCSDVDGYIKPAEQIFTASSATDARRNVSMGYIKHDGTTNPSNGVYIKDTEGYYHTTDAWDGTYTADCVAVITSSYRFGIALTEASSTMQIHNSYNGALENYMTAISNDTQAKADYDGATNTTNIMKLQSGTGYAAGWCNAFSFPSGKKGFLPSLGQMWAAYSNKAAVDAALTKAGGTALTSGYYWTSTFWGVLSNGNRYCWVLGWSGGGVNNYYLSGNRRVRAFSAL